MNYLIIALQLILSLSILVIIHELGHFIPAKLFKTRVEKFYLFFDPWFSLFKVKKGGTEYGIGWLPLGGYVKISGMIDESMDKEQLDKPAEPWEFRAKPTWQRLIIMVGGVTMNVLLAFLIFGLMLYTWGEEYLPVKNAKYGVMCDSVMLKHGFQDGDFILTCGGVEPETFQSISKDVLINEVRNLEVLRNGEKISITLPQNVEQELLENGSKMLFEPAIPFFVDTVLPNKPASKIDLKKGDQLIAINGVSTPFFHSFISEIRKYSGKEINLSYLRGTDTLNANIEVTDAGKIGVGPNPASHLEFKTVKYGLGEAFAKGISKSITTIKNQISSLKLMFTKQGIKQVGGFGAMATLFDTGGGWNWQNFWQMTGLISLLLAFMNILPIPALDGGHVIFLLYEMITGRKPHQKVMEYAQIAGMIILFTLMLYANGNDIFKKFFK